MRLTAMVPALVLGALPAFSSAQEADPCSAVSNAEVQATLGKAVVGGTRSDGPMPSEALKGLTRLGCSWQIGPQEKDLANQGSAFFSLVRLTSPEHSGGGAAFLKETGQALKFGGWDSKETTLGEMTCVVSKPPKERIKMGTNTGCSLEAKSMLVGFNASGAVGDVKIESVKALLEKAVSRLP